MTHSQVPPSIEFIYNLIGGAYGKVKRFLFKGHQIPPISMMSKKRDVSPPCLKPSSNGYKLSPTIVSLIKWGLVKGGGLNSYYCFLLISLLYHQFIILRGKENIHAIAWKNPATNNTIKKI